MSYFGIRHHGPGSAGALLAALEELQPTNVLVEGPADATGILPLLAREDMVPPVALLAYPADNPSHTAFYPFAMFSPEYQAVCWAVRHGAHLEFIDLPSTALLGDQETVDDETSTEPDESSKPADHKPIPNKELDPLDRYRRDPIGVLAEAAGYTDGESWWADLVEQNPDPGPIFEAIALAMAEVRDVSSKEGEDEVREQRREAHMRLAISSCAATASGPVAVVCGAWHVPALHTKHTKAEDRAIVGSLPRKKAQLTWVPWTSPRLSHIVGYGAGVAAPGWCKHLWENRDRTDMVSLWLVKIAQVVRKGGHLASTASLIDAERLAVGLAALRGRPQPGFEELREAAISVLFGGDTIVWRMVETELLLGNEVGVISADTPLAPLIADFETQARKANLKPEALERDLSVDLRSESGLFRSTLLHRLNILNVPWGRLTDSGNSRGTFRERWVLQFDPDFMVELVTHLVYGPTVEQASAGVLAEHFVEATSLNELATGIHQALTAALDTAVAQGLPLLWQRAALTSDCLDILSTFPPLANILRYGQARPTDLESLRDLFDRLVIEAGVTMRFAARGLNDDEAKTLADLLARGEAAIRLVHVSQDILDHWVGGLEAILADTQATPRVAGCVASLLYEAEVMDAQQVVALVGLRLSPGTSTVDAAGFFEGFFSSSAQRLLFDEGLRDAVDQWLISLAEDDFVNYLPLLRRVLSSLDSMERKRLITALDPKKKVAPSAVVEAPDQGEGWQQHLDQLTKILLGGAS